MNTKIELHIDADAVYLIDVYIDGMALILGTDYLVTGNTVITYLSGFLDALAIGNHQAEVIFSNGFIEKGMLIIKEPTPSSPPSSGGGGVRFLIRDKCPNGDFSPSYYDRICEVISSDKKDEKDVVDGEHDSAETGTKNTDK